MRNVLNRDNFREGVFARDHYKCVVCGEPAVDAHHILERRLWKDGGYYLDNGASVCRKHHIDCEKTLISVEEIREFSGITKSIIPEHMYSDVVYDKWGNIVLENGQRIRGELFEDESVQKILKEGGVLSLFTNRIKYPRTYHLPWSPGMHDDDRMIPDLKIFENQEVVVTEKLDGENTTIYSDGYIHARSIDGRNHWSRDWVKNFAQNFAYDLPDDWRICGENLYATHSIHYSNLESYFMGFSIWNGLTALSWDETCEWFKLLNIQHVPVLYRGLFDEAKIRSLGENMDFSSKEGYVVRLTDSFNYGKFRESVAKFVRKNHVATSKHWFHGTSFETNTMRE